MQRPGPGSTALLASALLLVSACSTVGPFGQEGALEETQRKYVRLMRWGEYDAASIFVTEDARERFAEEIPALQNVRFTDYRVLDTDMNTSGDQATVLVSYQAYHLNRLIEHGWSEKQTWKRGEEGEWRVTPDLEGLRSALRTMAPR